jgi:Asp-tRNA(Asn)/Glu-tRNA(Gln) amidotransferase A subunit family amidase
MYSDIPFMPANQLREWVIQKIISPVELTKIYLERIEEYNPLLHAFLTVCGDEAIREAQKAESAVIRGEPLGLLHGLPVGLKDLTQTRGIRTTRGSLIFENFIPRTDEPIVQRIRDSGGIIIGKTNTPEFGHRGTTENLLSPPCANPWDTSRTSGGSSGGSAVAVSSGLAAIAQGDDGGGSIRIPASFCGVFGMKPSFGFIPRQFRSGGGWNFISQTGALGRTVADTAMLLQAMAGPHEGDPRTINKITPKFFEELTVDIEGFLIAWSPDFGNFPIDPEVKSTTLNAAYMLGNNGAKIEELKYPLDTENSLKTFKTIFMSDMLANLNPLLERHGNLMMPSLRSWLEEAKTWSVIPLVEALGGLELHRAQLDSIFEKYDLLLTPTMAVPAFPIEQWPEVIDNIPVDKFWAFNPFCYLFNLTGQPAASIPCGFTEEGLPIGLHIIGRKGEDMKVLRAAAVYESLNPWLGRKPLR